MKIKLQKKYKGTEDQVFRYKNNDQWEAVDSHNMFITPQIVIKDSDENSTIIDYSDPQDSNDYGCRRVIGTDSNGNTIYDDTGITPVIKDVWYIDNDLSTNGKKVVFILNNFGTYQIQKRNINSDPSISVVIFPEVSDWTLVKRQIISFS